MATICLRLQRRRCVPVNILKCRIRKGSMETAKFQITSQNFEKGLEGMTLSLNNAVYCILFIIAMHNVFIR